MNAVLTLRPARSTDAGKLGVMLTEAVDSRPWKPRLHTGAQDIMHMGKLIDLGRVTVAELDDVVAGFLALDGHELDALFVAARAQGRGLGTVLLNEAKARSERLELWTFQQNTGAQRFYLRHGFAEVTRTQGDNEEGLPDIRYRWHRAAEETTA